MMNNNCIDEGKNAMFYNYYLAYSYLSCINFNNILRLVKFKKTSVKTLSNSM